ncbi:beta-ketoacyl reductase, partial [Streptomyces sp. NBRC 110028]|uniref:beta-ketoacyl reductase n=1 Tax=Streptomyces sp. NBRC 110028 TaxID=1621260 RepID=UPI00131E825C
SVLVPGIEQTLDALDQNAAVLGSLRRDEGGLDRLLTSLAEAFVQGVTVDWSRAFEGANPRTVDLPTYPFQRQHYWLMAEEAPVSQPPHSENSFWSAVVDADAEAAAELLGVDVEAIGAVMPALSSWHRQSQVRAEVNQWRYDVAWKRLTTGTLPEKPGNWLVVTPAGADTTFAESLARTAAAEPGVSVSFAKVDTAHPDRSQYAHALRQAVTGPENVDHLVSLLALDQATDDLPAAPSCLAASLVLAQALLDLGLVGEVPRLWLVTRGAVVAGTSDMGTVIDPVQAQVWGFGRVLGLEHPGLWGGLIDLPVEADEEVCRRFVGVVASAGFEDQVAVRGSGVWVRRLVRAAVDGGGGGWRPHGTVLVTGGTGGLGAHTARWLVAGGVDHVVLVSRRGDSAPGAGELVRELEHLGGARVSVWACDVADRAALEALLTGLGEPVTAVFHAAGVPQSTPLAEVSLQEAADVMAAKVAGAVNLDELLDASTLEAFVLFSSNAGVWGSGGQAVYAAANAFLDALAV